MTEKPSIFAEEVFHPLLGPFFYNMLRSQTFLTKEQSTISFTDIELKVFCWTQMSSYKYKPKKKKKGEEEGSNHSQMLVLEPSITITSCCKVWYRDSSECSD